MELSRPPLVVAFELSEERKAIVADALAGASAVVYLTELDEAARAEALRNTGALLTFNTSKCPSENILMWTAKNRGRYDRSKLRYPSDLTDDEWAHVEPLIPPAKRGGNKRHVEVCRRCRA